MANDIMIENLPLPMDVPQPPSLDRIPPRILHSATVETLISHNEDLSSRLKVHIRRNSQLEGQLVELELELEEAELARQSLTSQIEILREKDRAFAEKSSPLDGRLERGDGDGRLGRGDLLDEQAQHVGDAITSGGSVPYAFSWNTQPPQMAQSATGLLQGIYTCLLTDANGCTSTASGVVNDLAGGVVSISSVVPPDCFGTPSGSASAVITGGNPPFQYAWNTTPVQTNQVAAGLSAGNYIVLVTDANGCTSATSVLLTSPAALNVQSSSVSTFCNGSTGMGNIIVSSGNGGYSFHWNTIPVQTLATATGLGSGTYVCIVTDGAGCIDTSQVNIGYYNSGSVVIDSVSGPSCFGSNNGYALASVIGRERHLLATNGIRFLSKHHCR